MVGNWTWEEYFAAMSNIGRMMTEVDHTVDVLVDCFNMGDFPNVALQNISTANRTPPSNMGVQVIVGDSMMLEIMSSMLTKMNPNAARMYNYATSYDEAMGIIEKSRSSSGT